MALAVAFPFLFSYTQPPSTNFWPLMAAGLCGWVVAVVWNARSAGRVNTVRGGWMDRSEMATWLGAGLLLAAVLASAIGLLQYFGAAPGLDPWVHTAKPGQAMGNLRQRNQQATLLSMGLWALLWVVAQTEAHLRASSAGGSSAQAGADLHGGGRPWPLWLVGILTAWALALLAVGSAATASRTGLAQLLVILVLLALWRASVGRVALGLVLAGLAIYAVAAWLLPNLLLQWTGFRAEGLFARFGDAPGCTSRRVLWSNVLHLIAQKPWLGWGWGELDYAHYMTLFPGERFCVLLDNAHNLPLHLAVELGVPVAALLCFAVLAWVWKARPWSETDPARQLAWGILALVGCTACWSFRSGMARSRSSRCGPWRCFGAGVGWMQPYKSCGVCPWVCGRWLRWRVWCSGGRWGGSTTASARSTRLWRSACLPCATTPWRRCKAVGCSKMPLPLPS